MVFVAQSLHHEETRLATAGPGRAGLPGGLEPTDGFLPLDLTSLADARPYHNIHDFMSEHSAVCESNDLRGSIVKEEENHQ